MKRCTPNLSPQSIYRYRLLDSWKQACMFTFIALLWVHHNTHEYRNYLGHLFATWIAVWKARVITLWLVIFRSNLEIWVVIGTVFLIIYLYFNIIMVSELKNNNRCHVLFYSCLLLDFYSNNVLQFTKIKSDTLKCGLVQKQIFRLKFQRQIDKTNGITIIL